MTPQPTAPGWTTQNSGPDRAASRSHWACVAELSRIEIKAAPAAPLARRQRRALPLRGPPGARRATPPQGSQMKMAQRTPTGCNVGPSSSLPIVQLAAAASRAPTASLRADP
jgi:hypothetical protein